MANSIHVVRVDANTRADSRVWVSVRRMIESTEDLYPGIDVWLRKKVKPGLEDGTRSCYAAFKDGQPQAVAILKKGHPSKICTLRVAPEAEGRHLGTLLMLAIARELPESAGQLYFTIPESVWSSCAPFYEGFGFAMQGFARERYRSGDGELFCVGESRNILRSCLGRMCRLFRSLAENESDRAATPTLSAVTMQARVARFRSTVMDPLRDMGAASLMVRSENQPAQIACWTTIVNSFLASDFSRQLELESQSSESPNSLIHNGLSGDCGVASGVELGCTPSECSSVVAHLTRDGFQSLVSPAMPSHVEPPYQEQFLLSVLRAVMARCA